MYCCRKLNFYILIYAGFLILLCTPASAYVLKGEHVLQLMIEKINLPMRLSVNQTVSFFDPGTDGINTEYDQQVRYQIPGEFRSDIHTNGLNLIHVVASDQFLTVMDGRVVAGDEAWTDHYKDIFLYRSRELLVDQLKFLGIRFSVTSLGRYQGTICYILGAEYPDESVPQLWVVKDTFQPIRWIYEVSSVQDGFEKKEIRYSDWKSQYKSLYPSKIEFFHNDILIQSISVRKVEINPPFSGDLFDIEQVKREYSTEKPEKKNPGDQIDIKKRIEEFKNIYE